MVGSLAAFNVALLEPRHEVAETLPNLLDLVLLAFLAECFEVFASGVGLLDPLFGKFAGLDVPESALHLLFDGSVDDGWTGLHVTPLGGVGDGETHSGNAGFVDEVYRKLELVEALEVSHLGLVSRFDENFKTGRDELADATAKNGLLSEKVGLGLFLESGLENTGACTADSLGPSESNFLGLAVGVLLDRYERRNALALNELTANDVSGSLWCNHDYVDKIRKLDRFEVNSETV